jgi:hypothetical protein
MMKRGGPQSLRAASRQRESRLQWFGCGKERDQFSAESGATRISTGRSHSLIATAPSPSILPAASIVEGNKKRHSRGHSCGPRDDRDCAFN